MPYQERHVEGVSLSIGEDVTTTLNDRKLRRLVAAFLVAAVAISAGLLVLSGPGHVDEVSSPPEGRRMPTVPAPQLEFRR